MFIDISKNFKIPEQTSRLVLESIDHHMDTVNKDILELEYNDPSNSPKISSKNHITSLNKSKHYSLVNKRYNQIRLKEKMLKLQLEPNIKNKTIHKTEGNSIIHTSNEIKSKSINHTPKYLNQREYIEKLDKIDKDIINSMKSFQGTNELNISYQNNLKKKLGKVIQNENKRVMITSDEYLKFKEDDFMKNRTKLSESIDYILSKLTHADYFSIMKTIKSLNANKEKEKRKTLFKIEKERHELVMKLMNKIEKKA